MQDINKTKRELMGNAVRTAVYNATVAVLAKEGLEGLRMQYIANMAGLATGTLYNYFKNKDDLLCYVHERLFDDFFEQICSIANSKKSADMKIIQVTRAYFVFVRENLGIFRFLDEARIIDRHKEMTYSQAGEKCIGIFSEILQAGLEEGVFKDLDVDRTSELLHGCISGILKSKMQRNCLQPDQDAEDVVKLFSCYLSIKI